MHGFLKNRYTEETLIQKARKGDKYSFESLINLHLTVIYNYVCFHVNNREDIKDIIQESILSVWMGLKNFNANSSFKTWVIGIVRRKIADYFRITYKSKTESTYDFENDLIYDDETENIVFGLDIKQAIETLNDKEKEIIFLAFTAQLTYSEISEIMYIPVGTVKSKMSNIKIKLRKQLQEGE